MKLLYALSLSLFLFSSCEKVIDVDLNETNPQLVIEAPLYQGEQEFVVKVSQTASYFNEEEMVSIDDATVTLKGPGNEITLLTALGNGHYSAIINAVEEAFYTLEVSHSRGLFSATTYLHKVPELKELSFEETTIRPPFGAGDGIEGPSYFLSVLFQDVEGVSNYYRFNMLVNGEVMKPSRGGYFMTDDEGQDGAAIDYSLLSGFLSEEDEVELQLWAIDQNTYRFYETFGSLGSDNIVSASPANPQNNWSNGALGYFAGISISQKSTTILP